MLMDPHTSRVVFRHHFKGNKNFHHKSKRSKLSTGPFTHTRADSLCQCRGRNFSISLCTRNCSLGNPQTAASSANQPYELTQNVNKSLLYSFAMTSGLKMSAGSSRSLKFHDENISFSITNRYCAIWNPDLNGIGGWDTTGIKSIYSDDTVTSCFATKLGTFAVIGKLYDTPYVQPDFAWLMAVKMFGYFLSFAALIIFTVVVCMSKYFFRLQFKSFKRRLFYLPRYKIFYLYNNQI